MTTITVLPNLVSPRASRTATWRQFGLVTQWQFRRMAEMLPFIVVIQLCLAVATVFGYGLLIGTPPPDAARYLATGAATVNLIMLGLVLAPQQVAASRTEGSFAWMRTLPVPRWVFLLSDLTIYSLAVIPGMIASLLIGSWRFDVPLSVSPWVIVAAPIVAGIATCVGYSMALLLKPQIASLVTQVLVFIVLMFSPLSFPAYRFPAGVAAVHRWLPLEPMADLMRAVLLSSEFTFGLRDGVVLGAWAVAAAAGAMFVLRRRS